MLYSGDWHPFVSRKAWGSERLDQTMADIIFGWYGLCMPFHQSWSWCIESCIQLISSLPTPYHSWPDSIFIWHRPCKLSCQSWPHHMAPDMQPMTPNANADEALKGGKCWSEFIHKLSIDIRIWKDLDRVSCRTWSGTVRPYDALWCRQASQ